MRMVVSTFEYYTEFISFIIMSYMIIKAYFRVNIQRVDS
jgi:hypothetical protein